MIATDPDVAGYRLLLAVVLQQKGDLDHAEESVRRALLLDDTSSDAYSMYGVILWKKGRHDEAMKYVAHALELKPGDANTHLNYAIILEGSGKFTEAEDHYKKALEIHPEWPEVKARYDKLRYRLNDPSETLKKANTAKQANPEEAEGLYKKALEMRADSPEAHNDYGVFLWERKRVQEAEEHLQ